MKKILIVTVMCFAMTGFAQSKDEVYQNNKEISKKRSAAIAAGKDIACAKCNGSGKIDVAGKLGKQSCTDCKGTGKEIAAGKCSECKGKGRVDVKGRLGPQKCESCNGSGKIASR